MAGTESALAPVAVAARDDDEDGMGWDGREKWKWKPNAGCVQDDNDDGRKLQPKQRKIEGKQAEKQ